MLNWMLVKMGDFIDYDRFCICMKTKGGSHLKLGVLAKEMDVTVSALRDLLDGNFRKGLFEINASACSAFFSACSWLGVEASAFLTDGSDKNYPSDRIYRLKTGQVCRIFQRELKWCTVRVLMTDNPDEAYSYVRHSVRYEELEMLERIDDPA